MLKTVIDNKAISLTPGHCTVYVQVDSRVQRIEYPTPAIARRQYNRIINYRTLD